MPVSQEWIAALQKIRKKIEIARNTDPLAVDLLDVARTTLAPFGPDKGAEATLEIPDPSDVADYLCDAMPSATEIYPDNFFLAPMFPMVVLHNKGKFFNCSRIDDDYTTEAQISSAQKASKNVTIQLWFVAILDCSPSESRFLIDRYLHFRGPRNRFASAENNHGGASNVTVGSYQSGRAASAAPTAGQDIRIPPVPQPVNTQFPESIPEVQAQGHKSPHASRSGDVTAQNMEDPRKANYVQQSFKDKKFNGDLPQSIQTTLNLYQICLKQYSLTEKQRADFFVHVFEGSARLFFFNNVSDSMSFKDMKALMMNEYNSDARQMQVKGKLDTLRLKSYMHDNDITDVSEGLSKLVSHMEELASQCHPDFRADTHKINYFGKAVAEYKEWWQAPIQRITSGKLSLNGFVAALHEAIQNVKQLEQIICMSSGINTRHGDMHVDAKDTFIHQYGRHPESVCKSSIQPSRNKHGRTFDESHGRNECHKCGRPWKPGHRCDKSSIRQNIRSLLSNGESSVHIVSNLVQGLEGELESSTEQAESDSENVDEGAEEMHHGTAQSELAVFESLTQDTDPTVTSFVVAVDEEHYINHLGISMNDSRGAERISPSQGFR